MSFLRRLLMSILGIFDAIWIGCRNGLFGVPQPEPLARETAEAMAEAQIDQRTLDELHEQIAVERVKAAALDRAAAKSPVALVQVAMPVPEPEPERWYKVVGPSDDVYAYAHGTESEAQEYWEVGGDGWRVEPVTASEDLFVLQTVKGTGGRLRGARVRSLADELADWREERSSSYN